MKTDQQLRDAITQAGNKFSSHITAGSCEELLKLFKTVHAKETLTSPMQVIQSIRGEEND